MAPPIKSTCLASQFLSALAGVKVRPWLLVGPIRFQKATEPCSLQCVPSSLILESLSPVALPFARLTAILHSDKAWGFWSSS